MIIINILNLTKIRNFYWKGKKELVVSFFCKKGAVITDYPQFLVFHNRTIIRLILFDSWFPMTKTCIWRTHVPEITECSEAYDLTSVLD